MKPPTLTYYTTDALERRRRLIYLAVGVAIGLVLAIAVAVIGGPHACPPPQ